ncbi:GNAT family N-acetyltransferase [Flavivirga eckloniae]|uniref:N-acetyltransferase n=1 Tax=Flavivirga eckloniae TaxID=1803846 RepID=A0A2K9PK15_9FLAO|nr:GNAT family N-acetyltransferase [Flavivirga eckloniae]AUP77390.1 N-acetyltransferase [Flavivirga eckloniae]
MEVKPLDHIEFSKLMACFLKAFENYFVKMPTDHQFYKERWKMAKVRLDLSYGMFDNETLVGFIINAIDERYGELIAFNTGTGVLPQYRGQRIINTIYKHAIPELKSKGIFKCTLEVIKENTIAIKTYERIGFKITKNYKCYSGSLGIKDGVSNFELKQVDASYFTWGELHQDTYSWDNHINTIARGNYHFYSVLADGKPESYFIINPENGYIAQFNVLNDSPKNWDRLFEAISNVSNAIKINNVDEQLTSKVNALNIAGLQNTVDQYEMSFSLD